MDWFHLIKWIFVCCICKEKNINIFEQRRDIVYYKKSKKLDLEKIPPTSSIILLRIKRAYVQSYVLLRSSFLKILVIDPPDYGYKLQEGDDEEVVKQNIMTISLPKDLPIPCKCGNCARADVWFCVWTIYNAVSIATAKLKHAKILQTNTFYVEILC